MTCILHGCIREYYSILLSNTISPMGMSKEMKLWFYLKYPCSQRSVAPMRTIRFIKNHHWRFVSNKHIYIVRYHILGMIVCQAVEFHTVNHAVFLRKNNNKISYIQIFLWKNTTFYVNAIPFFILRRYNNHSPSPNRRMIGQQCLDG